MSGQQATSNGADAMPVSREIARDPPGTRRFRLIAPMLVLLCLALLAMAPGLLVHIGTGAQDSAPESIAWPGTYDGR
jgi:hypothetical protein